MQQKLQIIAARWRRLYLTSGRTKSPDLLLKADISPASLPNEIEGSRLLSVSSQVNNVGEVYWGVVRARTKGRLKRKRKKEEKATNLEAHYLPSFPSHN